MPAAPQLRLFFILNAPAPFPHSHPALTHTHTETNKILHCCAKVPFRCLHELFEGTYYTIGPIHFICLKGWADAEWMCVCVCLVLTVHCSFSKTDKIIFGCCCYSGVPTIGINVSTHTLLLRLLRPIHTVFCQYVLARVCVCIMEHVLIKKGLNFRMCGRINMEVNLSTATNSKWT